MNTCTIKTDGVETIVRFHDMRRIQELERALFSLIGQSQPPVNIILALQRLSDAERHQLLGVLQPLFELPGAPNLVIVRHEAAEPNDARSILVNLGFAATTARYIAILDYDDILYSEAYELLIDQLQASGAGIAFGGIGVKRVDVYCAFLHALSEENPFTGSTLPDLFRANFCPIHSFVVDRSRVPNEELRFEPTLTIEEDYEFLLRVCARVPSDFTLIDRKIGEYHYKTDNSNTVAGSAVISPAVRARIDAADTFNEGRRRITPLSKSVQQQLGLAKYRSELTIRAYLDEILDLAFTDGRETHP